jgi:DNA (cytosine-5)-methyltransferase 1
MQAVDLFSGCGGFSLGARAAGINTVLAIDNNPILSSSFTTNFRSTKMMPGDLSIIDKTAIQTAIGKSAIDIVYGGPPCQAFSSIGRRGQDDPRRKLLYHFYRIVSELRPAMFVMENVRGLGYVNAQDDLAAALELIEGKYKILGPIFLDASNYGAATKRGRLFVIGIDPNRCDSVELSEIEAQQRTAATVKAAIGDLSSAEEVDSKDGFDLWRITAPGRPSSYARALRSKDRLFTGHRRTAHTPEVVRRFSEIKPGEVDSVGRHPRLEWSGLCPTLRAGTGNDRGSYQSVRPIHPDEDRVITVREAARLQGFPDWFRFHPTIWHSFRMIGNSVSPIMAAAIFRVLVEKMESKDQVRAAAE